MSSTSHGALIRDPSTANFDFVYPLAMTRIRGELGFRDFTLQSRFCWSGPPGQEVLGKQHAVLAFTQAGDPNNIHNPENQVFWTHGVGAIVGEFGLGLELWFRSDPAGDGIQNDPGNAIVWTQENNRCAGYVFGTMPPGTMCLAGAPSTNGYLTPAYNFKLKRGVFYRLRVKISCVGQAAGWATLYADLSEETANGFAVNQSAMVGFMPDSFFPSPDQPIFAALARTPGMPEDLAVHYDVSDTYF